MYRVAQKVRLTPDKKGREIVRVSHPLFMLRVLTKSDTTFMLCL